MIRRLIIIVACLAVVALGGVVAVTASTPLLLATALLVAVLLADHLRCLDELDRARVERDEAVTWSRRQRDAVIAMRTRATLRAVPSRRDGAR